MEHDTTVLARSIYREGLRNIVAGSNPMSVRRGIEKAVTAAESNHFDCQAGFQQRRNAQVGAISANNDEIETCWLTRWSVLVKMESLLSKKVKRPKQLSISSTGCSLTKVIANFINRPAEMDCVMEDAYILIHEKKISNLQSLVPVLEKVGNTGKPLMIIAEDVDAVALTCWLLTNFVVTQVQQKARLGDRRKNMLGTLQS